MSNLPRTVGRWFVGCLAALAVLVVGCGGSNKGTVTGKVTLKDKPLANATVTFIPEGGKGTVSTRTDQNGNYKFEGSNKVPLGEATVTVFPPPPPTTGIRPPAKGPKSSEPPPTQGSMSGPPKRGAALILSPRYTDPQKSILKHTVTKGDQEYNIPLN